LGTTFSCLYLRSISTYYTTRNDFFIRGRSANKNKFDKEKTFLLLLSISALKIYLFICEKVAIINWKRSTIRSVKIEIWCQSCKTRKNVKLQKS
jgi:hypothetical protein